MLLLKFLQAYLLAAMISWVPIHSHVANGELEADVIARYEATAQDIAETALDPSEAKTLWAGKDGVVKDALLLAAVASIEGGFQKFVDDGTCNRPDYRADQRGGCDGHTAWTIWQIHTMGGLRIGGDYLTSVAYDQLNARQHPELFLRGPDLIASRKTAAKVALHIMRASFRDGGSLCIYAHEFCHGDIPKSTYRQARALNYLKTHPFTYPPAEVAMN